MDLPDVILEDDGPGEMPPSLGLIHDNIPDWAKFVDRNGNEFRISAAPPQASGKPTRPYFLTIYALADGEIEVAETIARHLLPAACPERHINPDADFCTGYEAGKNINDAQAAIDWWRKLQVFLLCQEVATTTGYWPKTAQLSHGTAGGIQVYAESVAQELGRQSDYALALLGKGPIASKLWQTIPGERKFLNGRAECICGRPGRAGKTKLRRECRKDNNPCLVLLEQDRRDAEDHFWTLTKGKKCCGTMKDCPMQDGWTAPKSTLRTAKARKQSRRL